MHLCGLQLTNTRAKQLRAPSMLFCFAGAAAALTTAHLTVRPQPVPKYSWPLCVVVKTKVKTKNAKSNSPETGLQAFIEYHEDKYRS